MNQQQEEKFPQILKCEEKETEYIIKDPQIKKQGNIIHENYKKGIYYNNKCLLISSAIHIALLIVALSTLISNNPKYKKLKEYILLNPDQGFSTDYTSFWCDIGKYELRILLTYLIYIILVSVFEIVFFLINKNKIHLEIGTGILYKTIIIIYYFIHTIFSFLVVLILYLAIYSCFVVTLSRRDFGIYSDTLKPPELIEWKKNRGIPIFHIVILFLLFQSYYYTLYFATKFILIHYLDLSFDDYDNNNRIINQNTKIKTKGIMINNFYINMKIKPNILFLLESEEENSRNGYKTFYQITNLEKFKGDIQFSAQCLKFQEVLM